MKPLFKSYTSFTRAERMGLAALSMLIVALVLLNIILRYSIRPQTDDIKAKDFITAWEKLKSPAADSLYTPATIGNEQIAERTSTPAVININTADSVELLSLKGVGPVTTHKILQWRAVHGPFTNFAQLKALGHFSATTFDTLTTHCSLSPAR